MTRVYQIETSSFCNTNCSYCPQHLMTRPQGNMSLTTFIQTLRTIENKYVALHHFGEPLLNPLLPDFIQLANNKGIQTEFSTNGSNLERLAKAIYARPYLVRLATDPFGVKPSVVSSLCELMGVKFEHHSVLKGTKPFINFAGAIEGESQVSGECYFKKYKYVVVLWDGRIVPCCCDYDGKEVLGDIWEGITHKETYDLCKNCSGLQFADRGLWEKI